MQALLYAQRTRKYTLCLPFVMLLLLVMASCGADTSTQSTSQAQAPAKTVAPLPTATVAPAKTVEISIVENNGRYTFNPATLTIPKGTEVKWINNSDAPHTATSDDSTFKGSSTLNEKQSYNLIFSTAGTYKFHCSIHTYMQGTITVTA